LQGKLNFLNKAIQATALTLGEDLQVGSANSSLSLAPPSSS
jgi:hypothetical protein